MHLGVQWCNVFITQVWINNVSITHNYDGLQTGDTGTIYAS